MLQTMEANMDIHLHRPDGSVYASTPSVDMLVNRASKGMAYPTDVAPLTRALETAELGEVVSMTSCRCFGVGSNMGKPVATYRVSRAEEIEVFREGDSWNIGYVRYVVPSSQAIYSVPVWSNATGTGYDVAGEGDVFATEEGTWVAYAGVWEPATEAVFRASMAAGAGPVDTRRLDWDDESQAYTME